MTEPTDPYAVESVTTTDYLDALASVKAREHLDRLDQRRRWLTARIKGKQSIGWETVYDESERDALIWALAQLKKSNGTRSER